MMIKPIDEILAYKNPYVIRRFQMTHKITEAEAEQIFEDVMRYLWLSAVVEEKRKHDVNVPDISIAEGMYIIDEMWHEFVLLTKMYTEFCQKYFGEYIHHPPELNKFGKNSKIMEETQAMEIFLGELIQCVIDYFGEEVALRWFDEYHKYLPDNYAELISHHTST